MARLTECRLIDAPSEPCPYQVHALFQWEDDDTREMTSYLAGFTTAEARARYIVMAGYEVQ